MKAGRFSIWGAVLVVVLAWVIWQQHKTEKAFLRPHQTIERSDIKEVLVWGELYRDLGNGMGRIERPQRRVTEQETEQLLAAFNQIRSDTVTIEHELPQTKFLAGISFYMKNKQRMINILYRDSRGILYVEKKGKKQSVYFSINEPDIREFFNAYLSDFLKESSE